MAFIEVIIQIWLLTRREQSFAVVNAFCVYSYLLGQPETVSMEHQSYFVRSTVRVTERLLHTNPVP